MSDIEEPDPCYYRYIMVDTRGLGSCRNCYNIGPVDMICLDCCVKAQGVTLGQCFACPHRGPVWEACEWCKEGQNLPPVYGICDVCDHRGEVGDECESCGDGKYIKGTV
jgi:hypothetical protein